MLYPVDILLDYLDIENPRQNKEETDWIYRVAQIVEEMDDEKYTYKHVFNTDTNTQSEHFGKGNAKLGFKAPYQPYKPNPPVFWRLKDRDRVWNAFSLLKPEQFVELCDECEHIWRLPRTGGDQEGSRKHGIETCLFVTLGILKTGMSDLEMEAVAQMSHGLINVEFERMLSILDKVLEPEMSLLTDWEKRYCSRAAKSYPNMLYYLDGCDFPVRVGENKFLYKTHKKNVKHQRAIRAQILIDS